MDFTAVGEDTANLMADLSADKEFSLELMMISTDSVENHRAWAESRAPLTMLGDGTGDVAREFGVLHTITHLAYSAMLLVDLDRVVQAVTGRGGIGVGEVGEVLDLPQ